MGLSWKFYDVLDGDIMGDYHGADYRNWHLQVFMEPNNMGDYAWKAWNHNTVGVTEIHGASPTIIGSKRAVKYVVDLMPRIA